MNFEFWILRQEKKEKLEGWGVEFWAVLGGGKSEVRDQKRAELEGKDGGVGGQMGKMLRYWRKELTRVGK